MKYEFSAGGIIFKKEKNITWILLCRHSQHHGWVFPKGLIEERELKELTAVREVKEETGADAKIIKSLPPAVYWYIRNDEKIKKTVYYYLMEFADGDITVHDREMDAVEWLPIHKVKDKLTYKSDKTVWYEAQAIIANLI